MSEVTGPVALRQTFQQRPILAGGVSGVSEGDSPALRGCRVCLVFPWALSSKGATLRPLSQNQCTDQLQALPGTQTWLGAQPPMGTETHPGIPAHQPHPRRVGVQSKSCPGVRTPVTLAVTGLPAHVDSVSWIVTLMKAG